MVFEIGFKLVFDGFEKPRKDHEKTKKRLPKKPSTVRKPPKITTFAKRAQTFHLAIRHKETETFGMEKELNAFSNRLRTLLDVFLSLIHAQGLTDCF